MNKSKSFLSKIRSSFLPGIIVTAPVGLTLYVAILFIGFIVIRRGHRKFILT